MKTTIKLMVILALLVVTFGQHTAASAGGGGGGSYKFKGRSADAFFSSTDSSGCIITDVGVFASRGVLQSPPGPGSAAAFTSVFISQYNACTGEQLLAADGSSVAGTDFQVDKKFNSATLSTTVNVFDYESNLSFDVDINLTWIATGPLTRQLGNTHYDSPGCKLHTHFNDRSRPAEASGSVSDGTTNFTPEPSSGATLFSTKIGTVVIGCN